MEKTLFKKIPRQKVSEKVFDQLKDLIVTGQLLPGQKIPGELELHQLFNVSRSSVREAILKLECLGFVEQRHGEGTFVKSATQGLVLDYMEELSQGKGFMAGLMEIREALEIWGAKAAAQRATDAEIKELLAIVDAMKQKTGQVQPRNKHNVQFHRQITLATHNPFLIHMMNAILEGIGTVTDRVYESPGTTQALYKEITGQHQAIARAIARKDPEAAGAAMETHLSFVSVRITPQDDTL